jgi:hypothetical protein
MTTLPLYTETLNYVHFSAEQLNRIHMVEVLSPIDESPILSKPGPDTIIYDTVYGSNWKIVRLRNVDTSVRVTAPVPAGYSFNEYLIRSWRAEFAIPPFVYNSSNPLVWVLADGVPFYGFDAYYH